MRKKIAKCEYSHYATNQLLKQMFKKRKEFADYKMLLIPGLLENAKSDLIYFYRGAL